MERLGGAAPGVPPVSAQINETNAPSLSGDVGGGFVRGVASGAFAIPRALSRVPSGFRDDINSLRRTREDIEPNRFGLRTPEQVAEDDARLRQISNSDINRFEQAALPAAPVTGAGKFTEALGSTAPYMAAGVAGPAGPAALGILAGTEESLGRSDASGIPLSDAQRLGVGAAGAAIGSTEALPFGRLLGRLKGAGVIADAVDETQLVKQLFPGLKDYAVSAGKQAIEEGVQEGTSNILQDVTEASYGGRPVNRIGEGLGESVTTGGGVGALVDVLTTLAGSRAGRARLSQNGVDPAALMAWVQSQEVSPSMTAEFDALARENRAPNPPQAAPMAAPTPNPAESPASPPPQQAEVAAQVPPPPPGFTVDPTPDALDQLAQELKARQQGENAGNATNSLKTPENALNPPANAPDAGIAGIVANNGVSGFNPANTPANPATSPRTMENAGGAGISSNFSNNPAQPVPAPGPREEVVQPVPVDAAAPVAARINEPDWKPVAAKWYGDASGAVDYVWKIGEDRSYEMVPFGNEDQARLIRKWDGEDQDLGVVDSLEEASRVAKQDASEMFAYDNPAQESDAPIPPEAPPPPSAVEAAAPEAQPPAAPKEPPAGVAASVKRYLDTIADVNRQLAEARTVDDKFGGEGRYENEVWDRLMGEGGAITAEASKKLQVFRDLAVKNGVDAEAFIEKMGGMPESPALSDRAKKYRGESVPPALESPGERSEAEKVVDEIVGDSGGTVASVDGLIDSYFSDPRKAVLDEIKKRLTDLQYNQVAFDELTNEQQTAISFIMANKVTDDADLPTVKIRRAGQPFSTPTVPIEDRGDAYMDRMFAIKRRIRKGEVPSNKDMAILSDADRAYMVKFGEAEGVVIPPRAAKGKKSAAVEEPVAPPAPVEQPKDFQWNGPVPNFENFKGREPNPAPSAPPPADSKVVYGKKSGTAKLSRGYSVPFTWGVVPAESLILSNEDNGDINNRFPKDLQPRQRDRAASEMQIQGIADKLDPEQVAESYVAGDGAPFIFDDMAVESGNGRGLAIRRAYRRKMAQAEAYRNWLENNAERFGLSTADVMAIENPVLVRVRTGLPEGVSRQDFARDANEDTKAQMAEGEQAMVDAKSMSDELVSMFMPNETGEIATRANFPFILRFIEQVVPEGQRGAMQLPDKSISKKGIDRIRNAVFARAYNDRGIVERLAEDPDDNIKSVVGGLTIAAPKIIWMRSGIEAGDFHDLDISPEIAAAAARLSYLRENRIPLSDYLNQMTLEPRDPIEDALLTMFNGYGRSSANVAEVLGEYVDAVQALGNPKQESMFGESTIPTKLELLGAIVEEKRARDEAAKREKQQRKAGREADQAGGLDAEGEPGGTGAGEGSPGPRPRAKGEGESEVVGYAPGGTLGAKPPSNGSRGKKATPPPAGPRTGTAVSRSEIVKNLSSFLNNIPIRTGGFRERAAGIFKVRQNVIRTAKALDLETISHEIGHAIHKYLWGTRKGSLVALNLAPLRPFRNELGLLDYDQNKKRAYEGFAEYIRLRITKPAEAKQRAPKFHAWFNQKLGEAPELADVLKKAQDQYLSWDIQPSTVKLAKSIDTKPNHETFMKRVTDGLTDFRYNWIDDKTGLRDAVELFQKLGATVADTANAYRLARTLSGTFTRANFAITNKTVGADNAPNGAGLGEILKPIADRDVSERNPAFQKLVDDWGIRLSDDGDGDGMDDFRVYIVARRLLDYRDKGLETGFTLRELKRAVADTETPALKAAADELHEYSGRILDYAYEKGAMSEATREAIRSKNEFYVPLHRVMDNVSEEDAKAMLGRKMLDLNSPILKRKGSTREIIDPLESVIKNTYAIMSFADRNAVAQALVKQAERVSDQGYLVESGIVNPMKATTFNLKEVSKDIMAALEEAGIDGSELELDHMSTIFRPNMDPRRSNGVVRVIVDGVPKLFQMDKNLIRALDNTEAQLVDPFKKAAANAAASLRFGATAGNPEFILTNFFRDQGIAGIQSRNGYLPIISGMWGAFKMLSDPKAFQEWQLAGGATAAMMPLTRKNLRLTVDKVTKSKKDLVLTHPAQIFPLMRDALTFFGEKSEASTRFAEYLLAKGKGKTTAEAVFDSRDVSLDFERMGKIAKTVNQFVPFFSVALNAGERFVEMHNPRNKKQFAQSLAKGLLGITIPTMMLWLLNKDDEEYKNVEAWKRDLFWLIPTKYFDPYLSKAIGVTAREAAGPFIRIPKPPMWGQLYGSFFERLADSLYSKNKHAFDDFKKTAFQTIMPPAAIQAIKPFEEVFSNYNAFTDRPIETAQMQKLSAENRYTPTTSELSKGISKVIGGSLSPVQVEHLLLGYTAGLGRVAITGGEELAGLRKDRPAMEASERPFVRAFATPSSPYLSTNFKLFKERLEKLKQKREDFKFSKNPKYRMTSADEAKLAKLEDINESVNEIRSKQFKVYGNKALSRDEKRRQIDLMNKQRDEILKRTKPLYD
jgi:hypothetical protein